MWLISKWKLRDVTSTVTLWPYIFSLKGLWDAHNIKEKVYKKDLQILLEVIKLVEKLYMAQQVTSTLSSSMVNMMSCDDRCFVSRKAILAITALMCSATMVLVLVTLPRTAQRKFPHQKHLIIIIDHTPTIAATTETGHTSLITEAGKGTTLTGQDNTIYLNMTEAPVTTRDMHPALYHTTTAACDIHPQTDTLEGTPVETPCTITDTICPWPNTLLTRVTLTTTLLTAASPGEGTPRTLPIDHTQGGLQSWNCKQQPPIDPSIRRRSLFIRAHQLDSSSESDKDFDTLNS